MKKKIYGDLNETSVELLTFLLFMVSMDVLFLYIVPPIDKDGIMLQGVFQICMFFIFYILLDLAVLSNCLMVSDNTIMYKSFMQNKNSSVDVNDTLYVIPVVEFKNSDGDITYKMFMLLTADRSLAFDVSYVQQVNMDQENKDVLVCPYRPKLLKALKELFDCEVINEEIFDYYNYQGILTYELHQNNFKGKNSKSKIKSFTKNNINTFFALFHISVFAGFVLTGIYWLIQDPGETVYYYGIVLMLLLCVCMVKFFVRHYAVSNESIIEKDVFGKMYRIIDLCNVEEIGISPVQETYSLPQCIYFSERKLDDSARRNLILTGIDGSVQFLGCTSQTKKILAYINRN